MTPEQPLFRHIRYADTYGVSSPRPLPPNDANERVLELLRAHVPLTLLMDLVIPQPRSEEIYLIERATR